MTATDQLRRLAASQSAMEVDWEQILEEAYGRYLSPLKEFSAMDIGAHAGRHSWPLLRLPGCHRLFLFEPLRDKFEYLTKAFAAEPRVTVHNCCLGSVDGGTVFVNNLTAPEESGMRRRSRYNTPDNKLKVEQRELRTMDSLELPKISFIKVDTEGAEIDIIKGGITLIQRDRPLISVEFGTGAYEAYGHQPESLFRQANLIGYVIHDLFGNPIPTLDEWRGCVDKYYWDYLLVPYEECARVSALLQDIPVFKKPS